MTRLFKQRFTLIELLTVITIIVLLASMLLPALTRARKLSQSIACKNNLKTINLGLQVYINDFADQYPFYILRSAGETGISNFHFYRMRSWPTYFFDTIRNTDVCYCPADAKRANRPKLPSDNINYMASYAYRYALAYAAEGKFLRPLRNPDFAKPSSQVIFNEITDWHRRGIALWTAEPPAYIGPIYLNALYVDGHVDQWTMPYFSTNYDSNWFININGSSDGKWNPRIGND